jgi:Holliday junction resolvase RusA-like endonuclease
MVINKLSMRDIIPPTVNHLYNTYVRNKRIIRTMTERGKNFKIAVGIVAKANKFKLLQKDCVFEYTLYCKLNGRSDLDNTFKAIQDSLEGIAYIKDSQITKIIATKKRNSGFDGFDLAIYEVS